MPELKISPFELLNNPLEGIHLIEASAGTGKTYTITGLFLRLILEKHLTVDKILVVTFTEAATSELKDRIRSKLREAMEAFSSGQCTSHNQSDARLINTLIHRHGHLQDGFKRLQTAIQDFDQSAIYTIHGFCHRMLHDHAFESGSLFDTELITDQDRLKQEIVEDFWRKHFYNASPLFVNYAIEKEINPKSLFSLLSNKISQPDLKIIPMVSQIHQDSSLQEKQFTDAFDKVYEEWQTSKSDIGKILLTDNGLNRNKYRETSIPNWILSMDIYMASGHKNPVIFDEFKKFTSGEINNSMKKGFSPPNHDVFDLCKDLKNKQEALADIFDKRILALKLELFQYVKHELAKRKQKNNTWSFDDLLISLHDALEGNSGSLLAQNIRDKFSAALIDEFQDTDPVQYAIFKKVFDTPDSILFLIGDPKQAIYGFRGADVFAYMDAAQHTPSRYTLTENWRSEPNLIEAVNTIFENKIPAFLYDEIPFAPVNAPADKPDAKYLTINETSEPPFQLWIVNNTEDSQKPMNKGQADELAVKAVAAEISYLLANKNNIQLGNDTLKESDIAVLVRKNTEARAIKDALLALNIPSVLYNVDNIFDSHEALELERILSAVVQPNNERLLRAALATEIMGISGEEFDMLAKNETEWEKQVVRFRTYHDTWHRHGFIRMFKQFMEQENVLIRLMKLHDGERRNTNLLHLTEILHQTYVEKKLNMAWLVKWLSEQRSSEQRLEEHQLRLESDENAVKLVTIHKSKGLEYPIVFCPFLWSSSRLRNDGKPFLFHDEADHRKLTLDIGSENKDESKKSAEKELLAENLRLLYVALTRAKNRCYMIWGRINTAETSAPAYLFHSDQDSQNLNSDILSSTETRFKALNDNDFFEKLKIIQNKAPDAICLSDMPSQAGQKYQPYSEKTDALDYRKFNRKIDHSFRVSSFSSLTSGRLHSAELADYDESVRDTTINKDLEGFRNLQGLADSDEVRKEKLEKRNEKSEDTISHASLLTSHSSALSIFSFPKGARAGIFLHDIFEHLDFTQDISVIEKLVQDKLRAYDFDAKWKDTLCHMIRNVLSVPLEPDRKDFMLSCISDADRLNELEFYFPLNLISSKVLKAVFQKYSTLVPKPELGNEIENPISHFSLLSSHFSDFPEHMEKLNFAPVKGFMKGFIDMVFQFKDRFYLIDWKSNFLGDTVEDYDIKGMSKAMKENYYILQYHLYTVALHQYLRLRKQDYDYESHFGGVYYIFLRGVEPEKGAEFGVFRDKPSVALIDELSEKLISNH